MEGFLFDFVVVFLPVWGAYKATDFRPFTSSVGRNRFSVFRQCLDLASVAATPNIRRF